MVWTINFAETAKKQLRKLDQQAARQHVVMQMLDGVLAQAGQR